ncbi:hypothetical protein WMY93_000648 [Mugilogobius chulae]|uniref:Ig-like domain-containing protein n=1 Tax=Mugilogobius chulae TaxID=88201 RepID=A0AAW0QAM0_9GOBI
MVTKFLSNWSFRAAKTTRQEEEQLKYFRISLDWWLTALLQLLGDSAPWNSHNAPGPGLKSLTLFYGRITLQGSYHLFCGYKKKAPQCSSAVLLAAVITHEGGACTVTYQNRAAAGRPPADLTRQRAGDLPGECTNNHRDSLDAAKDSTVFTLNHCGEAKCVVVSVRGAVSQDASSTGPVLNPPPPGGERERGPVCAEEFDERKGTLAADNFVECAVLPGARRPVGGPRERVVLSCVVFNYSGIVQWTKDGLALGIGEGLREEGRREAERKSGSVSNTQVKYLFEVLALFLSSNKRAVTEREKKERERRRGRRREGEREERDREREREIERENKGGDRERKRGKRKARRQWERKNSERERERGQREKEGEERGERGRKKREKGEKARKGERLREKKREL